MMPILEQSPVNHHHGHGHQTFYHLPEQTSKIQLTLILPNGVSSALNVDANTPMMDLLVQAASLNKLNPSAYSLVVLDSNQHVIQFKPNQTVGQIGSSTISLLPKETTHATPSPKTKTQPFEITVRLQVNLPDAQKILLRIDPTLPLHEIKEQICKQKKYSHSNQYTFRLPNKLDQPLLLGLSLAEYKTNELTLIHNKQFEHDDQLNPNQLQSFDRLYRTRSESQPPKETFQDIHLTNAKQACQSNTNRPSHTSLHAYWNDPNFDTQSQISNNSLIAKKRRAPRPPGYTSADPQIVYIHRQQPPNHPPSPPLRIDHHQSHESLHSENTKKKRKAPVVAGINSAPKTDQTDKIEQQNQTNNNIARPGLEPPPPPPTTNTISPPNEDPHPTIELDVPCATDTNLVVAISSAEPTNTTTHSPEQVQTESPNLAPRITEQQPEQNVIPTNIQSDINKSPIPKPPRQNVYQEKKSSTIGGLLRIINDHTDRAHNYQNNDKQQNETNENISYFRVAKSRYGKFETDNRGFVHNSIAIFDSTNQQKPEQQSNKTSQSSEVCASTAQHKSLPITTHHQTKGKQAYDLLKKYEKEEKLQSPAPVQLEVTERSTHITVTVASDHKHLIAQTSSVLQQPPLVAPKPFAKTMTEYRTVRRIGNNDEPTSSTDKRSTTNDNNHRLNTNSAPSHDALMESIRRFGGSQSLGKKE